MIVRSFDHKPIIHHQAATLEAIEFCIKYEMRMLGSILLEALVSIVTAGKLSEMLLLADSLDARKAAAGILRRGLELHQDAFYAASQQLRLSAMPYFDRAERLPSTGLWALALAQIQVLERSSLIPSETAYGVEYSENFLARLESLE